MDNTQPETNIPQPISKKLLVLNGLLAASILTMIFLIYDGVKKPHLEEENRQEKVVINHAFDNIVVEAKSAYVFDVESNSVLYEKNAVAQLPLASLTKLMTALAAVELLPKNSNITIKQEFLEEEGDSGLLAEESWKLKDLLDFSLVSSSNDGARSIASVVGALDLKTENYDLGREDFLKKMNSLAGELDLKQTYFLNESGLDIGSNSGGYGSAQDVEKLLQYILKNKPELLEATKYRTLTIQSKDASHVARNTNTVSDTIPGLMASKTGFTRLAGGNLAIAFDPALGRPIIVIVLGSSEEGRFKDVQTLVAASLKYISQ